MRVRVKATWLCALFIFAHAAPVIGQVWLPARPIGLLEPQLDLEPQHSPGCYSELFDDASTAGPLLVLPVYSAPSGQAEQIGNIRCHAWTHEDRTASIGYSFFDGESESSQPLDPVESGYEVIVLPVLARNRNWYRIDLPNGSGWLQAPPGSEFRSLYALIEEGLSHLTDHWDRRLCLGSSVTDCVEVRIDDPNPAVKVIEQRVVKGMPWWRIELMNASLCRIEEPKVLDTGWVPAYGRNGRPTVWFSSRGC